MVRLDVLSLIAAFLTWSVSAGCGGDDGNQSTRKLSGKVGSDWSVGSEASALRRLDSSDSGGIAHIVGGSTVDTAVAIPLRTRNWADAIEVPVEADGTFTFDFGDQEESWLILLVYSAAPLEERIVAYVSMGAGNDTMMAFPPLERALDLGTVERSGDEAVSRTSVEESTSSFTLSVEDLLAVAATDDAYKPLINGYLNYDRDAGTFFDPQMQFRWQGSIATFLRGEASPESMIFEGYSLDVRTNGLGVSPSDVCEGRSVLALYPPAEVRNIFGRAWAPEAPITTAPPRDGAVGSHCNDVGVADDGGGGGAKMLSFGRRLADLGEGFWSLRLDDETIAAFDLGVRDPNEGGAIRAPVAIPLVEEDDRGVIQSVSLRWYLFDGSTYVEVIDPTRLEQVLEGVSISISNDTSGPTEYVDLSSTTDVATFEGSWTLTEELFSSEESTGNATTIAVGYYIAGNTYGFFWGPSEIEPTLVPHDAQARRPVPGSPATAELTVSMNQATAETVVVDWTTVDGSATEAAGDYVPASGTLTFPPGTVSQSVGVTLPSPANLQSKAELFIELSNARFASIERARGPIQLLPAPTITASSTQETVVEGEDWIVNFSVDQPLPFDARVVVDTFPADTSAKEAEASVDFERPTLELVIPAGEIQVSLNVPTIPDIELEQAEVMHLILRNPIGGKLASTMVSATLLDGARSDFRLEAPTRVFEGQETTVTIRTDVAPTEAVPMQIAFDGPTFDFLGTPSILLDPTDVVGGFGPSPFLFPPGVTSHTITFTPAVDEGAETDEPLTLILNYPTDAPLASQFVDVISVAIQDTGSLLTATCTEGEEGGRPAQVELRWSAGHAAAQPVVVSFETTNGTAVGGTDFVSTAGSQSFFDDPLGEEEPLYLGIPIIDDLDVEGEERFTVSISGPEGLRVSPPELECIVSDNDE